MEVECLGRIIGEDCISIDPLIIGQAKIGDMIKLKVLVPDPAKKAVKRELSPAAKRLLARMEHAKPLGLPKDPRELSHSLLAEEKMEEKLP